MPDKRKHRGAHPADEQLFAADQVPRLRQGAADLSWLLSRGYAEKASLKLVGDRFRLKARQRMALARSACSQQALALRRQKEVTPSEIEGREVFIDTFNLLITLESSLAGGFLFEGRDAAYRDLASIHGSYKRVAETEASICLCGEELAALRPARVYWWLDKPVSNSGRLKAIIDAAARRQSWPWEAELFFNPDTQLVAVPGIVITSDSIILNQTKEWCNFARYVVDRRVKDARIIRLFAAA